MNSGLGLKTRRSSSPVRRTSRHFAETHGRAGAVLNTLYVRAQFIASKFLRQHEQLLEVDLRICSYYRSFVW